MEKNRSICDGINLDDQQLKRIILQNKGAVKQERILSERKRIVVKVSWNKRKMFFNCSIVFLEKQNNGSWKCVVRFDDNHECRHMDVDLPTGRAKMIYGRLTLAKVECPILSGIIDSLPKEKADAWKIRLFHEITLGNHKRKEFLKNPKIHLLAS